MEKAKVRRSVLAVTYSKKASPYCSPTLRTQGQAPGDVYNKYRANYNSVSPIAGTRPFHPASPPKTIFLTAVRCGRYHHKRDEFL